MSRHPLVVGRGYYMSSVASERVFGGVFGGAMQEV